MSIGRLVLLLLLYGAVQLLDGGESLSTSTSGGGLERADSAMREFLAFLIEDTNEMWAKQLAGAARSTEQRDLLEEGDVEEAMRAAEAIGDDALQKGAGRAVDTFAARTL